MMACNKTQVINNRRKTHRNEQIRHPSLILEPGLPVLGPAALDIPQSTVADHASEENRVEPRERAAEASDQTPVQRKVQVASVVDLASLAVCRFIS